MSPNFPYPTPCSDRTHHYHLSYNQAHDNQIALEMNDGGAPTSLPQSLLRGMEFPPGKQQYWVAADTQLHLSNQPKTSINSQLSQSPNEHEPLDMQHPLFSPNEKNSRHKLFTLREREERVKADSSQNGGNLVQSQQHKVSASIPHRSVSPELYSIKDTKPTITNDVFLKPAANNDPTDIEARLRSLLLKHSNGTPTLEQLKTELNVDEETVIQTLIFLIKKQTEMN